MSSSSLDPPEPPNSSHVIPAVTLVSFGYIYGHPPKTDLNISVKKFPNPSKHIRTSYNGTMKRLQEDLMGTSGFNSMYQDVLNQIITRINEHDNNVDTLTIGIGCEKGKHRSVAIVEMLQRSLNNTQVQVVHRDLEKKSRSKKLTQQYNKRRQEKRNITYDY